MQAYFSLQKSLFNSKKVSGRVEGPLMGNFDVPPESFTVTLLIAFNFEHFLT